MKELALMLCCIGYFVIHSRKLKCKIMQVRQEQGAVKKFIWTSIKCEPQKEKNLLTYNILKLNKIL